MKIERVISWFDERTEEQKGEFPLHNVCFYTLKSIFKPQADDPLMYNPYTISEKEGRRLAEVLDFSFDFDQNIYQIDCSQVDKIPAS